LVPTLNSSNKVLFFPSDLQFCLKLTEGRFGTFTLYTHTHTHTHMNVVVLLRCYVRAEESEYLFHYLGTRDTRLHFVNFRANKVKKFDKI
jgi:hypothetical protein